MTSFARRILPLPWVFLFFAVASCSTTNDPEPGPPTGGSSSTGAQTGSGGDVPGSGAQPGDGGMGQGATATGGVLGGGGSDSGGASGGSLVGGTGGVTEPSPRDRILFNDGWKFEKGDPQGATGLAYEQSKAWVLPTGNDFVSDPGSRASLPEENLGDAVSYRAVDFDDASWQTVTLPHDYAIEGPYTDSVSSSMGCLPSPGVAWYRKTFSIPTEDEGKSVFLDLEGAMQYSLVWVNGTIVGGWPYGYASYRLDLTEHLNFGGENVVAVRLHTPVPASSSWDAGSSRWYPGAGIYRDVWLVKTAPVHVAQWGTYVTTPDVSDAAASVNVEITLENDGDAAQMVSVETQVFERGLGGGPVGSAVATLDTTTVDVPAGQRVVTTATGSLPQPKLWGVPPSGEPNMYVVVTRVLAGEELVDRYETPFGVRTLTFDGDGFALNGERLKVRGVCLHHDLGALGAAASFRARERQLAIMQEMGSNGIRTAHNPFEPAFYDLADRMGFLVMDEAFDVWNEGKAEHDHHEFFDEWHERDLRALLRRDRNHPSIFMWSIGNELVEQFDDAAGPAMGQKLTEICHEEDPTRPTVAGMNKAEPDSPFSGPIDTIGLNYQGTGVRDLGAQYPTYHAAFPDKFIVGTETTSTFSTRGTYLFPVTSAVGEATSGSVGADSQNGWISSYDLYHADWSYSPDEEFESQDKWPYVGGEFVWTGFDYLGEPTPLDAVARSSYFGIVDLAGFKKDRFFLYQAYYRPDLPMAHILPHWTWPDRVGQTTPVHVYTSGDEAELFLNGQSLGRKAKSQVQYRLRWDDVSYQPGELAVVAYKDGQQWATDTVETAGDAAALELTVDRAAIIGNGRDLAFVTARVVDAEGRLVPRASQTVTFAATGPGSIVATDNGDPTDRQVFSSLQRDAFSGMALAIVRPAPGASGEIVVSATAGGLTAGQVSITAE